MPDVVRRATFVLDFETGQARVETPDVRGIVAAQENITESVLTTAASVRSLNGLFGRLATLMTGKLGVAVAGLAVGYRIWNSLVEEGNRRLEEQQRLMQEHADRILELQHLREEEAGVRRSAAEEERKDLRLIAGQSEAQVIAEFSLAEANKALLQSRNLAGRGASRGLPFREFQEFARERRQGAISATRETKQAFDSYIRELVSRRSRIDAQLKSIAAEQEENPFQDTTAAELDLLGERGDISTKLQDANLQLDTLLRNFERTMQLLIDKQRQVESGGLSQ